MGAPSLLLRTAALLAASLLLLPGPATARQEDAPAIPGEARQAFEALTGADGAARDAAYAALESTRLGGLAPALEAYRSGLLERREDGRLVIYQPREEVDGLLMFPLVDAWTLEPVTGSDGDRVYAAGLGGAMLRPPPEDAERLGRLIAILSLHHPDEARRRNAIVEAANRTDVEQLAGLREQLSAAPEGGLATTLQESIARIELAAGADLDVRRAAVRVLGDLGTSRAITSLRAALDQARRDGDVELAAEAGAALGRAEGYQQRIRIIQHTFAGLSLASILVLLALGLSVIFGLMRVINLAHGEFMMVGAYATYTVAEAFKLYLPGFFDYYYFLALPLAFLSACAVGMLCEAVVIRHLYGRPIETLLATWGISLLLIQTARLIFGDTTSLTPPRWLQGGWEVGPDLVFPLNRVFIIVFCVLCVAAVYLLVYRSRFGLLLRATTQDRPIAASLAVRTRRVDSLTFGLGTGLAGLAGAAVPLYDRLNPNIGQSYIVDSFMVVVVGGVGKLAGAITAGSALGFTTKYLEPWLEAVYGKLAVLALIILFLQWRPSGLFPHRGRTVED